MLSDNTNLLSWNVSDPLSKETIKVVTAYGTLFDFIDVRKTLKKQSGRISLYQPQRRRTLGHLVSTVAGTYKSTTLDIKTKHKQMQGGRLLLSVIT